MFEKHKSSSRRGSIGVHFAAFKLAAEGYIVSLPITDCQDYDLVIGDTKGHRLYTVQVKSTSQKQKDGSYKVTLKNGGRRQDDNTWSPAKDFNENKVDYVCVVTSEHECYLIPRSSLTQKSGFRLNERFESFKL